MGTILYTVARTPAGTLVRAEESERDQIYSCPVCNSELILKKSGRTGKGSKRPHFAHRSLTPNCTPETALHFTFKNLLADLLRERIAKSERFDFSWQCEHCGNTHSGDLLRTAAYAHIEHNLGACQPDIALLNSDGKVIAAVEVVVTHKPSAKALDHYEQHRIAMIQIHLRSDFDLDAVERVAAEPSRVTVCRNPRCDECGRFTRDAYMIILKGACWACGEKMAAAIIELRGNPCKKLVDPGRFTGGDIDLAMEHGVDVNSRWAIYDGQVTNICPRCKSRVSSYQLQTSWFYKEFAKEKPVPPIYIGTRCDHDSDPEF